MTRILAVIFIFGLSYSLNAQNVSNILGTGGTFTIKNSTNNYFTVSQSLGEVFIAKTLRLENTNSAGNVGVIFMGSDRFMHNYSFGSTHLGTNSGNFGLGILNTAVGHTTMLLNTNGSANCVLGYIALGFNSSGTSNSAFGYASMFFNSTGNYNSAFGHVSLVNNSAGFYNSAFGDSSMAFNTTGDSNCAFGYQSLASNTTGSQNSAFGRQSLLLNSTGSFNTAIGHISGSTITTGSNLTCIGYASQPSTGTSVNQFTLGNNTLQSLRCNVTSITSLSDRRDKKNIKDLTVGIDFLMKIRPRMFNWDKREWYENNISDGSKLQEIPSAGFIAQELDDAATNENASWLNLVMKDNPDKWEATYGNLLPVIVKAVQELKKENDALMNENTRLANENKEFESLLKGLEESQDVLSVQVQKMRSNEKTVNIKSERTGDLK